MLSLQANISVSKRLESTRNMQDIFECIECEVKLKSSLMSDHLARVHGVSINYQSHASKGGDFSQNFENFSNQFSMKFYFISVWDLSLKSKIYFKSFQLDMSHMQYKFQAKETADWARKSTTSSDPTKYIRLSMQSMCEVISSTLFATRTWTSTREKDFIQMPIVSSKIQVRTGTFFSRFSTFFIALVPTSVDISNRNMNNQTAWIARVMILYHYNQIKNLPWSTFVNCVVKFSSRVTGKNNSPVQWWAIWKCMNLWNHSVKQLVDHA